MTRSNGVNLRMHGESEATAMIIKDQGLRVAVKPMEDMPRLPQDITSIDDETLMDLFVSLTTWNDYLSVQVACAQIDERAAQRTMDFAENSSLINGWKGGSQDRVAIAKANVAVDPEVHKLRKDLDEKHAYRKLIEVMSNNVERDASLVSRELTRRTSGAAAPNRRATRWST